MPDIATILIVLLVLLLFLAALVLLRGVFYGKVPPPAEAVELAQVNTQAAADRLSAAIRQDTVSTMDRSRPVPRSFDELREWIERTYPRLHATLQRERINEHSLLYCWPGSAAQAELEPVMLCGHLDVVPVDPSTEREWTYPPFSGRVADGYVWGRGALDMKSNVIAVLESVEALLEAGYEPDRTLYLAFGHDEEIGGFQGARRIADWLVERGVRLSVVLDEGPGILQEALPGLEVPAAVVGVAEKGYAAIELRVEGRPGHSSTPPRHTAIGVLSRAIARLENHPRPARLNLARMTLEALGPFLPLNTRLALANGWLLGGRLRGALEERPLTNALLRSTMAVTVIEGGIKDNVLPALARAAVSARLLPGDRPGDIVEHIRKVIDDEAVQVRLVEDAFWDAAPVSPVEGPAYTSLADTVRQIFPDVAVAPALLPAVTDSRHYSRVCSHVYRFSPYLLDPALQRTVHGIDERIPVDALERMIQFYTQIIQVWTGGK